VCVGGLLGPLAWAVPIDAGMAIVLWIGIVIAAQAFQATPRAHAPAVVIGLLPGLAAWAVMMAKNGLRAAGAGSPDGVAFGPGLVDAFKASDTWIAGGFALEQGFIFTAMILASATVAIIDGRPRLAAGWMLVACIGAATGLMHGYAFTPRDTVLALGPAWPWGAGYAAMALVFGLAPWITERDPAAHEPGHSDRAAGRHRES